MLVIFYLVVFNIYFFNSNEAARILAVFPAPSISHQAVFRPLNQELARRGHEVTIITPDPAFSKGGTPANLTEIDVHDVSYKIWTDTIKTMPKGKNDLMNQIKTFLELSFAIVNAQLSHEDVKSLINNKNVTFDLLLLEACVRNALAFSYVYKVPVIQISSFGASYGNYESVGAPDHPILYTSINRQRINNLSMWAKLTEIYNYYITARINKQFEALENVMLRTHFGPDMPSLAELNDNVHMLFLNVHPVFEGIRPVPPTVVYMGGLHQKPDKELPSDLKLILDSSKNGVIYISFGTNVDTSVFTVDKIRIIVGVLSQLPYDVLWKWDAEELPGRSDNIRISKWWPQSDLLRGLQSTDEAITAAVPLIGIPMIGDQWFNTERYEYHNIGVKLDMDMLTEGSFKNAINKIIGDDSYHQNVVKLRNRMYDQPMKPLERAVWWTEHVLRHGGARHLRAPAANISWTQYLELELVLTVLIVLFVIMFCSIFAFYLLYKHIVARYKEKVGIKVKCS